MRYPVISRSRPNPKWSGWYSIKSALVFGALRLLILGAILRTGSATADEFYRNPVIPGDHPDPSIIRSGKYFWATCTSSEWGPQFDLLRSTDLVNWQLVGAVFPHRPTWAVGNFWAPEISEFKGKFAVYYVGRKLNGPLAVAVATADKPEGPYVDHGPIIAQDDGSIDPAPVTDEHGDRYLIWKEDGNSRKQPSIIWAQRLNEDGTGLLDQPHELIRNDVEWEGGVVEGPFILHHDDWFYLFYSGNGCCGVGCNYAMGVARSHALLGPWEKNPLNPILAANETWKCPGHGSIVEDGRDRCFLLYHAYSTGGSIFTGREALLDEVTFGAWPVINNNNGPSVVALSPFGAKQRKNLANFSESFFGEGLDKGWQWPQDREPVCHLEYNHLSLASSGNQTNYLAAILARPTTAADYTASASIETESLKPGCAAGLCAIGDEENAMGAVICDGNVITWRRDHGVQRELSRTKTPNQSPLSLTLVAKGGYHFQFFLSGHSDLWLPCGNTADARNLPPWDRSVRVALTAGGIPHAEGIFKSFSFKSSVKPVGDVSK